MRLGVHLIRFDFAGGAAAIGPVIAEVGRAAEAAALDNLSVMDHYFEMEWLGSAELPMLEGYTTLGFLAANTGSVDLQLLVTGVTYRPPGLLAKIVATLDVLSGGRALLGIGAAWYEREHRGLGVHFPPVRERFERLEETLQIVRQMWGEDNGPYDGQHYRLAETICSPRPLHTPEIMIGGMGERKTLRLVAKYGDACNMFANPGAGPDAIRQKLDVLRRHCDSEATDYDRIRKTILWSAQFDPASRADEFLGQMEKFAALGVEEVHVMDFGHEPAEFVRGLGRSVVPRLSQI